MSGSDQGGERPVLVGRSSSHFTRVARLFAAECGVDCSFRVVRDLGSRDPAHYGDNPALKIPVLHTERGTWFGALNICRELARRAPRAPHVVWPEAFTTPLLANAQELVLHAMATEVQLIMAEVAGAGESSASVKPRDSLLGTLAWLERHCAEVLQALPEARELSYLEVTLFCLVTHLEFRNVAPTEPYPALRAWCERFAERPSAQQTPYRFDA